MRAGQAGEEVQPPLRANASKEANLKRKEVKEMRFNHLEKGYINEIGLKAFLQKKYPWLRFEVTESFSPPDKRGVDVVGYDGSRAVYFAQAKSSWIGAVRFGERFINGTRIHIWFVDEEGDWQEYVP